MAAEVPNLPGPETVGDPVSFYERLGAGIAALGLGGWAVLKRFKLIGKSKEDAVDWRALVDAINNNTRAVEEMTSAVRQLENRLEGVHTETVLKIGEFMQPLRSKLDVLLDRGGRGRE